MKQLQSKNKKLVSKFDSSCSIITKANNVSSIFDACEKLSEAFETCKQSGDTSLMLEHRAFDKGVFEVVCKHLSRKHSKLLFVHLVFTYIIKAVEKSREKAMTLKVVERLVQLLEQKVTTGAAFALSNVLRKNKPAIIEAEELGILTVLSNYFKYVDPNLNSLLNGSMLSLAASLFSTGHFPENVVKPYVEIAYIEAHIPRITQQHFIMYLDGFLRLDKMAQYVYELGGVHTFLVKLWEKDYLSHEEESDSLKCLITLYTEVPEARKQAFTEGSAKLLVNTLESHCEHPVIMYDTVSAIFSLSIFGTVSTYPPALDVGSLKSLYFYGLLENLMNILPGLCRPDNSVIDDLMNTSFTLLNLLYSRIDEACIEIIESGFHEKLHNTILGIEQKVLTDALFRDNVFQLIARILAKFLEIKFSGHDRCLKFVDMVSNFGDFPKSKRKATLKLISRLHRVDTAKPMTDWKIASNFG